MTDNDILKRIKADSKPPNEDALEALREIVRQRRELDLQISVLEEELSRANSEKREMDHFTLPGLFQDVGVDTVGLPAEGNRPAIDAKLSDYYHANIPTNWPEDRRQAAFARMMLLSWGDLLRRTIEVSFGPKDPAWQKVAAALEALDIPFKVRLSVPWATLTAAVKDHYNSGKKLSAGDLDTIGATVGQVVKIKQRSDT